MMSLVNHDQYNSNVKLSEIGFLCFSRPRYQLSVYRIIGSLVKMNKCCNDSKFSDRQALANSADPDQTAPRGAV